MINHKVGDLVWIPANSTLLSITKKEKLIERMLITSDPHVALVISDFDDNRTCIFLNEQYWVIEKKMIFEVPDVPDIRCS